MSRLKLYFFTISLIFQSSVALISDKRLCIDEECNSPISRAKTLHKYFSPEPYQLSFKPHEDVVIYSKSAGSNENLWGVEINGKRGYVPKQFVRETKIFGRPTKLVDTEVRKDEPNAQVPSTRENVNPTRVKQSHEVIDGTTIYHSTQDEQYSSIDEGRVETQTELPLESVEMDKNIQDSNITEEFSENNETNISATTEDGLNTENIDGKVNEIIEVTKNNIREEQEESVPNASSEQGYFSEILDNVFEMALDTTDAIISGYKEERESRKSIEHEVEEEVNHSINKMEKNSISLDSSKEDLPSELKMDVEQTLNLETKSSIVDNLSKSDSVNENISAGNNASVSSMKKDELELISEDAKIDMESTTENNNSFTSINNVPESTPQSNVETNENPSVESIPADENVEQFSSKSSGEIYASKNESLPHIPDNLKKVGEVTDSEENEETNIEKTDVNKNEDLNINILHNETSDSTESDQVLPTNFENPSLHNTSDQEPAPFIYPESIQLSNSENINIENLESSEVPSSIGSSSEEKKSDYKTDVENTSPSNEKEINSEKELYMFNNVYNNYILGGETPKNVLEDNPATTENEKIHSEKGVEIAKDTVEPKIADPNFENSNQTSDLNYEEEPNVNIPQSQEEQVEDSSQSSNVPSSIFDYMKEKDRREEISTEGAFISNDVEAEHKEKIDDRDIEEKSNLNSELVEDSYCTMEKCPEQTEDTLSNYFKHFSLAMELPGVGSDIFIYLVTTAVSVILFLLGHFALDKSRRERPLVAKINKLEKEFLILLKEKELLTEQIENNTQQNDYVESQDFLNLQKEKQALEEQIQTLEKELENSTELGLELNRMLSDVLSSENAGETLMVNIEGLQSQLAEQQGIVSNMKEILSLKETENHELHLELDIANKRAAELQNELDKLLLNIIKVEEEKELVEKNSETEMSELKKTIDSLKIELEDLKRENGKKIDDLSKQLSTSERNLQLKVREYKGLTETVHQMKNMKNTNNLNTLVDINSVKAELEQMKAECKSHCDLLNREKETNSTLQKIVQSSEVEIQNFKQKYDEVDKTRLELQTKLQVLTNYFKEREDDLQKELSKYESMWSEKQGEATSTSERIKYLQSEVQNYKTQNETLKQEIASQEVELRSQISVLDKVVHENWLSARLAERKLEDLKLEASQLRNRLTLRERAIQEDSARNRMQSPLEQSGELPVSPIHLENPSSPPLLYNSREHITKSPPILGMPPPFLPPPHGAPFLPPPHLPFMPPPPPDMYPGDHRPPPLGRMSSPPLNSRYSPDRRSYSPYEGRSPSPSYDESEYGTSPAHHSRYSSFSGRREHRWSGKVNGRSGAISSGSGNSNESLDELNYSNTNV